MENYDATIKFRPVYRKPRLFIFSEGKVMEYLVPASMTTIGRGSRQKVPDIVIGNRVVSRIHGEIFVDSGIYFYRNLSYSNRTIVNRHLMKPGEVCRLVNGTRLFIHPVYDEDHEKDVLILFLFTYREEVSWQKISLGEKITAINVGRAESFKIHDDSISRHHACFLSSKGRWAILDLESTNGVLLNQQRLREAAYLTFGDVVDIAGYLFVFLENSLFAQTPKVSSEPVKKREFSEKKYDSDAVLSIDIAEKNVWSRWKKKTLLKDIKLDVHTGEFVLILGGSGAGKTTFINAVMGYEKAKGNIVYKNMDLYDQYRKMKYEIGYVPQQITLREDDNVEETLMDAAEMRLPSSVGYEERKRKVQQVIRTLGLQEQAKEEIRKISGGQKKRVSLAVEYLGNPSLFFLDEPDSGIDESESMEIMKNLRTIADEKKIVMLISHSPDRLQESHLLNKVIVLTKSRRDGSGHLAFFGTPKKALEFFDVKKLSEIVRKINPVSEGGEGRADEFIQKYQRYIKR